MDASPHFQRAGLLTVVPFLGTLALMLVDLFKILGDAGGSTLAEAFDPELADYAPFIAVMMAASALPPILLALSPSAAKRWLVLGICGLLFVFHAIHIVEHFVYADYYGVLLIIVTAIAPYGLALNIVFRAAIATGESSVPQQTTQA